MIEWFLQYIDAVRGTIDFSITYQFIIPLLRYIL